MGAMRRFEVERGAGGGQRRGLSRRADVRWARAGGRGVRRRVAAGTGGPWKAPEGGGSDVGQVGLTRPNLGDDAGQIFADLGQVWADLGKFPTLASLGTTSTDFGAEFGQSWITLG